MIKLVEQFWEVLGWRSIVFNRFGYSDIDFTGERITGFDCYADFHQIVKEAKRKFNGCDVYLFGCSLGAAFIQRYVQEFPGDHDIEAMVCVSSPYNVVRAAQNFHDQFLIRKSIVSIQKEIMKKHIG